MTVLLHQQKVGRFEIRDFLGRGAIGDVLLAWDPQSQSEVALKVVRIGKSDPEMLDAERNGIALQAQIARVAPQVAAVHEEGEDDDFYWVCMEYVPGNDLSRVLDRGALAEDRAVHIARQLCAMLEVCHGFTAEVGERRIHGIVHGDIKPENIRLQDEDRVRVLDFGIAKHLSNTRRFTVNLFGSLPYTPPERLDRGVVDRHSDLWAVGVVLYIMASGRRPFAGRTPEEVEQSIMAGDLQPLPETVSPALQRIIRKSLAFSVERRYQSAAELDADLQALHEGRADVAADLDTTRRTGRPAHPISPILPISPPPAPGAPGEALDSTRRTDRVERAVPLPPAAAATMAEMAGRAEATRRTHEAPMAAGSVGAAGAAGAPPAASTVPPPPPAALFPEAEQDETLSRMRPRRERKPRRWLLLGLLGAFLLALGFHQMMLRGEASDIRRELVGADATALPALAERFRRVDRWAFIPSSTVQGAREELRQALIEDADRVINAFHGDTPVTTERGWQRAYDDLRAAVDLSILDRETRAKMVYARAHLDRIASQTLRQKGEVQAANEKLQEAVAGFRSAARWNGDWPDPYLGLARVYAYEQSDLGKLEGALGELGRRGYPLGRREKAMLADGYRMRGRDFQARAARARGTDDEERLLEQSRESFIEAMNQYDEIRGYANVEQNRTDAENRIDEITTRLRELDGGFSIDFEIPF